MLPDIGRAALIVAFVVAVCQSLIPLLGASRRDLRLMSFGDTAATAQALFVTLSFGCLVASFVASDFSVAIVATNSHTDKPLLYRIAATWGNHEGSMLLWSLVLALFGAAIAANRAIPPTLRARVLSVQGMIGAGFLAFILFTSSPFERLFPIPAQGNGLNPLLEDPGLAFHPPSYFGYVGSRPRFRRRQPDRRKGGSRLARLRVLGARGMVAADTGIAGGSPGPTTNWLADGGAGSVETQSFMPWLLGTALLHCIFRGTSSMRS
jgi:cytochrome c-type biogenesis protein CcmF